VEVGPRLHGEAPVAGDREAVLPHRRHLPFVVYSKTCGRKARPRVSDGGKKRVKALGFRVRGRLKGTVPMPEENFSGRR
jgi:hypothetical protein